MPNYKRSFVDGGTLFFTAVAFNRQKIFTSPIFRTALKKAIQQTRQKHPFVIDAWVLLPDHIHCIWTLPKNDNDYSLCNKTLLTPSKIKRNESTIWQRRFWEHTISNNSDYKNHLNYIYWNPVKHGYSNLVSEWPYSTFHRDVKNGLYDEKWGDNFKEEKSINFGE